MADTPSFVSWTAPDARPYLRMIIERMFPALPVLSQSRSPAASNPVARGHFVIPLQPETILATFAIFCRIGGLSP